MRFSTEANYKKYVEGYGFLSFARKFGDKCGKKLMDTATKTEMRAPKNIIYCFQKNSSKNYRSYRRFNWKKIADKISLAGKTKSKEKEDETNKRQEIYIPPEKKTANNRRLKIVLNTI